MSARGGTIILAVLLVGTAPASAAAKGRVVASVSSVVGHRAFVVRHRRYVALHRGSRVLQHETIVLGPSSRATLRFRLHRRSHFSDKANVLYIFRYHGRTRPAVKRVQRQWGLFGHAAKTRRTLLIAPRLLELRP